MKINLVHYACLFHSIFVIPSTLSFQMSIFPNPTSEASAQFCMEENKNSSKKLKLLLSYIKVSSLQRTSKKFSFTDK